MVVFKGNFTAKERAACEFFKERLGIEGEVTIERDADAVSRYQAYAKHGRIVLFVREDYDSGPMPPVFCDIANASRVTYYEVLAHEFVHLRQYDTGHLVEAPFGVIWQGNAWSYPRIELTDYIYRPWEFEAIKLQAGLAKEFAAWYSKQEREVA